MTTTDSADRTAEGLFRFCDYLEHRLYTQNVELLRRIITEFHATPRHLVTVHSLLAVGFPAITILPVDIDDDIALDYACALRRQIRGGRGRAMDAMALRDLYAVLHRTIQLTNWHWLLAMYSDFCAGIDTTVTDFVLRGEAAIAIFPVAPISMQPSAEVSRAFVTPPECPESEMEMQEVKSMRSRDEPCAYNEIVEAIHHAVKRIERKAPWEQIYDVSMIVFPFNARAHPDLADRFRMFWERHARAVWERNFWPTFPHAKEVPGTVYYERKLRQQYAAAHFVKRVILPIFDTFGARFFVELDAQPHALHWWWYRTQSVDLLKLAAAVGLEECLKYINTQAKKREPKPPPAFRWNQTRTVCMWSTMDRTQHVANAIEEFQMAHTIRAARNKRKVACLEPTI